MGIFIIPIIFDHLDELADIKHADKATVLNVNSYLNFFLRHYAKFARFLSEYS